MHGLITTIRAVRLCVWSFLIVNSAHALRIDFNNRSVVESNFTPPPPVSSSVGLTGSSAIDWRNVPGQTLSVFSGHPTAPSQSRWCGSFYFRYSGGFASSFQFGLMQESSTFGEFRVPDEAPSLYVDVGLNGFDLMVQSEYVNSSFFHPLTAGNWYLVQMQVAQRGTDPIILDYRVNAQIFNASSNGVIGGLVGSVTSEFSTVAFQNGGFVYPFFSCMRSASAVVDFIDDLRISDNGTPFHLATEPLIWQHPDTGALGAWSVVGGELASVPPIAPVSFVGTNWSLRSVRDFDGDQKPDFLWQSSTGQLALWIMNGLSRRAVLTIAPNLVVADRWKIVAVGDVNGDHHQDIIWQDNQTLRLAAWIMNANQRVRTQLLSSIQIGSRQRIAAAGDFNRDDYCDLVVENKDSGHVLVYLMHGNNLLAVEPVETFAPNGPEWQTVAVQDMDLDGSPDLIRQNIETGEMLIWYLDRTTMEIYRELPQVKDIRWRVRNR